MNACTCRLVNSCLDDVPGRQLRDRAANPAARVLRQPLVERRAEAHRGELRVAERRLHLVVVGEQATVRPRVVLAEAGDLTDRPLLVQPHRELLAIGERHVGHRVWVDVAQTVVLPEAELVPGQQGVHPDQGVPGGAGVDLVAGEQDLLRSRPAARDVPRVENQAPVAGLGQVAGGDQAVVPGSGNDNIRVHDIRTHMQTFASGPARHKSHARTARTNGTHESHARVARTRGTQGEPLGQGRDQPGPGHGRGLGQAAVDHHVRAVGADLDLWQHRGDLRQRRGDRLGEARRLADAAAKDNQ